MYLLKALIFMTIWASSLWPSSSSIYPWLYALANTSIGEFWLAMPETGGRFSNVSRNFVNTDLKVEVIFDGWYTVPELGSYDTEWIIIHGLGFLGTSFQKFALGEILQPRPIFCYNRIESLSHLVLADKVSLKM